MKGDNDYLAISQIEEKLLFIILYKEVEKEKFEEFSLKYVKALCDVKEVNKIKQLFEDYFSNTSTREY